MYKIILTERRSGRTTKIIRELTDDDVMIVDYKHVKPDGYGTKKNILSTKSLNTLIGKRIKTVYIDCVYNVESGLRQFIIEQLSRGTDVIMYQDIGFIDVDIFNDIWNTIENEEKFEEMAIKLTYDKKYGDTFVKQFKYGIITGKGELQVKYGIL